MILKRTRYIFLKQLAIKVFFIAMLSTLFSLSSQSQTTQEINLKEKADKYMQQEKYDTAIIFYERLVQINKWNFEYTFVLGYCYYSSKKRMKEKAIEMFEKVIKYRRTNEYPETYYYLGRCYQLVGKFEKATDNYNNFFKYIENTRAGRELRSQINEYIKSTYLAINLKEQNKNKMMVVNAGEKVNSEFDDYNPIVTKDGLNLIYISKKPKLEKTTDYTYYYYYNPNKDVYKSSRAKVSDANFEKPKSIGNQIEKNPSLINVGKDQLFFNESPFGDLSLVNPNSDSIFISLDEKKGLGGRDIYMAMKKNDGTLEHITNLGPTVNSTYDEISPYFDFKNKTLYFSSNKPDGIGGYDVYKSSFANGNWSKPENLGYPINTPMDDYNYILNDDGSRAYYASSQEAGFGGLDIYYVDFLTDTTKKDQKKQTAIVVAEAKPAKVPEQNLTASTVKTVIPGAAKTIIPKNTANVIFNDSTLKNIVSFDEKKSLKAYLKTKLVKSTGTTMDTIFVVQIGAYRKNVSVSFFKGFKEVIGLLLSDQIYRYYVIPTYNDAQSAIEIKQTAIKIGYTDAFVTTVILN